MRKEAKVSKSANIARVQGYHGGHWGTESYAFSDFPKGFIYCNSDRTEPIIDGCRKSGQTMKGFGLEVEVQSNIPNQMALAELLEKVVFQRFKFPEMFKMQDDGSLGGESSAECITCPMTESRIRNDYQAWKLLFDYYFPAFGISADAYRTSCGMHVNLSVGLFGDTPEEVEENIRKLYYIINKHYDLCRKLFYRPANRTHWCGQMDYSSAWTLNMHNMPSSHTNCFNGSHYDAGRVEIRLVGGQKDFDTFLKTMECIFFLVKKVRKLSRADCDNIEKIFRGCNQAVYARLSKNNTISSETMQNIKNTVKHDADLDIFLD